MDADLDQCSHASGGAAEEESIIAVAVEGSGGEGEGGGVDEGEPIVLRVGEINNGDVLTEGQKLPDGWAVHSICGRVYDATIYEENKGGKPGQKPSPVWACCVQRKEDKHILCLLCPRLFTTSSTSNVKPHLKKHSWFVQYGGEDGDEEKSGGVVSYWTAERRARIVRIIACFVAVDGRYVMLCSCAFDSNICCSLHTLPAPSKTQSIHHTRITHTHAHNTTPTHSPLETARKELFQKLIFEATLGQMASPCTDTLRKEIELVAKNIKAAMMEQIKNAQPGTRSLSADGWTAG